MKRMLPLLIGLLLAAAAAYYFLKKKDVALPSIDDLSDTSSKKLLDLNDTDSIIDSLSLAGSLNSKAKDWVKHINKAVASGTNGWSRNSLQNKAKENDITYSQQVVLSALWQMYATSGSITKDQFKSFEGELESLGE